MKFGQNDISDRIIVKRDLVFAFPAIMPILPGHVLVCPCRPVAKLEELLKEEILALFQLITDIKKALKHALGSTGFNIAWNESFVAGQTVPHLHVHIVPRSKDDGGIVDYEPRKFLYRPGVRENSPIKELQNIAKLIKENLM